jgi:CDP-glucose 4,6-dehydratase
VGSFWSGKKVFITGHTGFKGSWLALWLNKLGAEVTGYALKPHTNPSLYDISWLENIVQSIIADINDADKLNKTLNEIQPDFIFHLSAQALVRESYKDPVYTYQTNVMGTLNLFEAVRKLNKKVIVINITSDKCYDNKEVDYGYCESDAMGGYDPYSSSKGCSELVTTAYRNSFFNPNMYEINHKVSLASVRAGNVIGGGDFSADRLIPDVFRSILNNERLIIRCPDSIRPWQHVLEPLNGYMMLAQNMWERPVEFCEGFNFGANNEDSIPVRKILEKISQIYNGEINYEIDQNENPHEAHFLKLNCDKAKKILGWKPLFDIENALKFTVEWFEAYKRGEDITLKQITEYEKLKNEVC